MGVETEAKIGVATPVLEVVGGGEAGSGEVGDLDLGDAGGSEQAAGELVEGGGVVVGGDVGCAVAGAGGEDLAAEAGLVVDLEHVDAEVGDAGGDGLLHRAAPGGGGLVGEAGDEVEREVEDAGAADAVDLVEALAFGVEAADGGGFAVDEALDAEAEAVDAVELEGFEGFGAELVGGALDGDLGVGAEGEVGAEGGEETVDVGWREEAGGAAAEVEGVD